MRPHVAAALQLAPLQGGVSQALVAKNCANAVEWVERCVSNTGAELVVLPESVTTGFNPNCPTEELWEAVSDLPGRVSEAFQEAARRLGVHLIWGTYERGPSPAVVFNSSVLAGPSGEILGTYRKTHPFATEKVSRGGWVQSGEDTVVVSTELGRIGMMICFDGDFPEVARIQALQGAEIIARPSALLRSADIWDLTNRARAYDNHVFIVASNATGSDAAGTHYFGNSMIVNPIAEVMARGSSHDTWVSAYLDPNVALSALTPGSGVPHNFDHLSDRNVALVGKYLELFAKPACSAFARAGLDSRLRRSSI